MKKLKQLIIIILTMIIISSCEPYIAPRITDLAKKDNSKFLKELSNTISQVEEFKSNNLLQGFGDTVLLYPEITKLFNPDELQCGLSEKIRDRIKESKREGEEGTGFIPNIVYRQISSYEKAIKMDGRGANVLLHLFHYKNGNTISKPILASEAPTSSNFNSSVFIDNKNEAYENFFYTMDCSGYFSATAKVAVKSGFLGIGKIEVAAEGEQTLDKEQAIMVSKSLIHSPLYSAYIGSNYFNLTNDTSLTINDKIARISMAINNLKSVIQAIPTQDRNDSTLVYINANYEAVLTSNKGKSGFNGQGSLNGNLSLSIGGNGGSSSMNANNAIGRTSRFESYDTYVLNDNVNVALENITVKTILTKISELEEKIESLQQNS